MMALEMNHLKLGKGFREEKNTLWNYMIILHFTYKMEIKIFYDYFKIVHVNIKID